MIITESGQLFLNSYYSRKLIKKEKVYRLFLFVFRLYTKLYT